MRSNIIVICDELRTWILYNFLNLRRSHFIRNTQIIVQLWGGGGQIGGQIFY